MNNKILNVYNEKSIVEKSYIDTDHKEIPHKHYIDKNGNVQVVVNGFKIEELVKEPLFRNTFSVISGKVNNPEKING